MLIFLLLYIPLVLPTAWKLCTNCLYFITFDGLCVIIQNKWVLKIANFKNNFLSSTILIRKRDMIKMKQLSGEMWGLDHILIIKLNFTTINEISSTQETFKLCKQILFFYSNFLSQWWYLFKILFQQSESD